MMNVTEQRVERQNALFKQMQVAQYQAQVAAAQRAQVAAEQQRQQQEAAQQAYRGTIPPNQQALYDVAPREYAKQQIEALTADQEQPKRYTVGGSLVDAQGNVIYQPDAAPIPQADSFKMEKDLRSGFDKNVSAFREIANAHTTIQSVPDTSIGDIALSTKIMKLLDPGSVVRESELGVALNSTGIMQRLLNYAEMAKSGQRLNPSQRAEFRQLATDVYSAAENEFEGIATRYTNMSNRYGLDPANVVYDYRSKVKAPPGSGVGEIVRDQSGAPITAPPLGFVPMPSGKTGAW